MASCFIITRVTNTVNDVSKLEEIGDFDGLCNRSNLLSNIVYREMNISSGYGEGRSQKAKGGNRMKPYDTSDA